MLPASQRLPLLERHRMSNDPSLRASTPSRAGTSNPFDTDDVPGRPVAPPAGKKKQLNLEEGTVPVDGYVLEARLGRGGFGEVWQASGPGGFKVAMKFIRLEESAGTVESRSLELTKQLKHPNLLAQFGAWEKDGFLIIAMELGNGTLYDRLKADASRGLSGIARPDLLEYMREAAKAIDYLNGQNIQHRDIKPQNLLLVGTGVKVADFGLAKLLENTVNSASGSMTPAYAAPEFFNGQATRWSDQYCLAVAYCQLRGHQLPFTGNAAQVVAGHLTRAPDLSMLPDEERPVVARALSKEPNRRWPSCLAFVEALHGAAVTQHAGHAAPPAFPPSAGISATTKLPQAQIPTERPKPAWRGPSATLPVPPPPSPALPAKGGSATALILISALLLGGGAGIGLLLWMNKGPVETKPTHVAEGGSKVTNAPTPSQGGAKGTGSSTTSQGGNVTPSRRDTAPLIPTSVVPPQPTEPKPLPALLLPMLPPVTLEAGGRTTVTVNFARMNCPGPVEVRLVNLPFGVRSNNVIVPSDQKTATFELIAQADAQATSRRVTIEAVCGPTRATMPLQLLVKASTAVSLRLRSLPNLSVMAGGTTSINIRVERTNCPGTIPLRWEGLPAGVTATPRQMPENFDIVTVTLRSEPGTAPGRHSLKLVADHPRAAAQSETKLVVVPFQTADDQRWANLPEGPRLLYSQYSAQQKESLVLLLDATTGQPLISLQRISGTGSFFRVSRDARRFALVTSTGPVSQSEIRVMDAATGRWLGTTIRLDERVRDLTFSLDGRRLYAGAGKELICWDADKGTQLWKRELSSDLSRLAAGPDRIACCCVPNTLALFDEKSGMERWKTQADSGTYAGLAFSADGKQVAVIHSTRAVHVYETAAGKRKTVLQHPGIVYWTSFSPDGKTLATGCADRAARLWDVESGNVTRVLTHNNIVGRVWFTADGESLITSETQAFYLWNARTGERRGEPFRRSIIASATFTPDRRRVAVRLWDASVRVWDPLTRQPVSLPMEHTDEVNLTIFSPSGRELLTGSRDGSTRVWNVETGRPLTPIRRHRELVNRGLFSPDGRTVVTISTGVSRNEIKVWDARSGNTLGDVPELPALITDIVFTPDNFRLAALCGGKTVVVWDVRSGKEVWRVTLTESGLRLFCSEDGKELRIEGGSKVQRLDAATGKQMDNAAPGMIGD
jgi:WD40 repeat protein/serine/threonine protein kinase